MLAAKAPSCDSNQKCISRDGINTIVILRGKIEVLGKQIARQRKVAVLPDRPNIYSNTDAQSSGEGSRSGVESLGCMYSFATEVHLGYS